MRRAGMLCVVLGIFVAGCGGSGQPQQVSLFVTCGSAVGEGTTVRLTLEGNDFEVGNVVVTADIGTVAHLTVDSPELISFDYTAPMFPPGTLGPKTARFTVNAGPGTIPSTCEATIHLTPFITSCITSYAPDHGAAPTTAVYAGTFIHATITGGNFLPGGALLLQPRDGSFLPLTEIGLAAAFSAPGQFRVTSGTTLELTVPDVFSNGTPTILDGSPNVGPATVRFLSPFAALATEEACFRYVPAFVDFQAYLLDVPGSVKGLGPVAGLSAPGKVTIGDVNRDGVPDIVVLAEQTSISGPDAPEAFLLLADTFGPGVDRDGDGKSPDFAGTFTAQVINDPNVRTWVPEEGRGQNILLVNLDDDPEPEIVLAVRDGLGEAVMLVDIQPGGVVGATTILRTTTTSSFTAGIAVGDFDHKSPHQDIAVLYGSSDPAQRKLVIFRSNAAFDYTATTHDIPAAYESYEPGALGAGDFDGDGDDDLIWGQYDGGPPGSDEETRPLLVARVDADLGTVDAPQEITNVAGSPVVDIDVFDANGDGRKDAVVFFGGEMGGSLTGDPDHLGAGVVTLLDAFSLEADALVETPYRFATWDRSGNGRGLAHGDFDGDRIPDVATVNDFGEVLVLHGTGDGSFLPSERSWQMVTGDTEQESPVQGLDAGDFDGDGLSEIVVGDMSNAPFNLVYWLNGSR